MKIFIATLFLLVLTLPAFGAAHVEVNAQDFMSGNITNRRVTLTLTSPLPRASGTALISQEPKTQVTGTNGITIFSNVIWGIYRCDIAGTPSTSFRLTVDTNVSGVTSAAYLLGTTNQPSPVTGFYTRAQVDALVAYPFVRTNDTRSAIIQSNTLAASVWAYVAAQVQGATNNSALWHTTNGLMKADSFTEDVNADGYNLSNLGSVGIAAWTITNVGAGLRFYSGEDFIATLDGYDLMVTGQVAATEFKGNGHFLTSIKGSAITNAGSAIYSNASTFAKSVDPINATNTLWQATTNYFYTSNLIYLAWSNALWISAARTNHVHAGSDITSGTVPDARLSTNVVLLNANKTITVTNAAETGVSNTVIGIGSLVITNVAGAGSNSVLLISDATATPILVVSNKLVGIGGMPYSTYKLNVEGAARVTSYISCNAVGASGSAGSGYFLSSFGNLHALHDGYLQWGGNSWSDQRGGIIFGRNSGANGGQATAQSNNPAIYFNGETNNPTLQIQVGTNISVLASLRGSNSTWSGSITVTNGVYEGEQTLTYATNLSVGLQTNYTLTLSDHSTITAVTGDVTGLVGSTTIAVTNSSTDTKILALNATGWKAKNYYLTNGYYWLLSIRGGAFKASAITPDL